MRRKFIVKQNDIKDCGVCCLQSIIKYYGGYIPLEILRLDTKTNQNGTTAYNILNAAFKYGFNGYGRRLNSLEEDVQLPAIAHIITDKGINHFVVVYSIKKDFIYVMDPAKGFVKVHKDIFIKNWTNIMLVLKPYKTIPLYKINNNIKDLIINIIHCEKTLISKLIVLNFLIILLSLVLSYHYQVSVWGLKYYIYISFMFLICTLFKLYINYLRNKVTIDLSANIDLSIIPSFVSHIIMLPLNVIKSRTTGEVLTRVQDLNVIKNLFSEILVNIILDFSLLCSCGIFLYTINNELFFILCVISFFYLIVGLLSSPIINRKINDNIDLETEFNSKLGETVESLETIKNCNIVDFHRSKILSNFSNYVMGIFNFNTFYNVLNTIYLSINDIGLFCINSYGIYLYSIDKLTLVSLITFNSLLSYYIESLKNIVQCIPNLYQIKLSYIKANEFLSVREEKLGICNEFINGDIKFCNVSYSYDDYNNVLNNINLTFKQHKHYILKGITGCGKSTLLKMLNHNIDDYKGDISIGDVNIKDYSLRTLRSNVLYVSQNEMIFTDTIYNNLVLDRDVSNADLNSILKITKVDELLNKKSLRLDSILYDNGFNLSGGERQRIVLARSLLRNPMILILDESLSEVDKNTEKYILDQLDRIYNNVTIIYITHTANTSFKNIIKITNNV